MLVASYAVLRRAREQGNLSVASGELAKPELLMLAGECAIKNARFEMAAESVRTFFLMDPPRDQFCCRALFCQALVESEIARPLNGAGAVRQIRRATGYVMGAR